MMLSVDVREARRALLSVAVAMLGRRMTVGARMIADVRAHELAEAERCAERVAKGER